MAKKTRTSTATKKRAKSKTSKQSARLIPQAKANARSAAKRARESAAKPAPIESESTALAVVNPPNAGVTSTEMEQFTGSLSEQWNAAADHERYEPHKAPEPGFYYDVPFGEYAMWDAVNNSSLSALAISPLHYKARTQREDTPSLAFGSLCHDGTLEPDKFFSRYVVIPEKDFIEKCPTGRMVKGEWQEYANIKMTGAYKDLVRNFESWANSNGKQIVSAQWYAELKGVIQTIYSDERTRECFTDGRPEVSIVWDCPFTGIRCKGRIDFLPNGRRPHALTAKWWSDECTVGPPPFFSDLKTSGQLIKQWFLEHYDYQRQMAFYVIGLHTLTGVLYEPWLSVVEKAHPHGLNTAPVDHETIELGMREIKFLMLLLKQCREENKWPNYIHPDCWQTSKYYKPVYLNGDPQNDTLWEQPVSLPTPNRPAITDK